MDYCVLKTGIFAVACCRSLHVRDVICVWQEKGMAQGHAQHKRQKCGIPKWKERKNTLAFSLVC